MKIFNEERSEYYKAKKRDLALANEKSTVAKEDALYIHYYGMDAYLELFPEAKYFGMSWHENVVNELEKLRKKHLGQQLSGFYMASAAVKNKSASRKFRALIKSLTSR